MKFIYILLLSTVLNASCSQEETEASNAFFFQASEAKTLETQVELLQKSLEACFSYEVEVSLLLLKVDKSTKSKEKETLYDELLESLSNIENNDAMVKAMQKKINRELAKIYADKNPELSAIYEQKSDAQNEVEEQKEKNYLFWIVSLLALLLWALWDLLKKWGKF